MGLWQLEAQRAKVTAEAKGTVEIGMTCGAGAAGCSLPDARGAFP
jgi:hypothetical protein